MKNIQAHVYLPEPHMQAIRAAAKRELRTPQNLLSYLLQNSEQYQSIIQHYKEPSASKGTTCTVKTNQH